MIVQIFSRVATLLKMCVCITLFPTLNNHIIFKSNQYNFFVSSKSILNKMNLTLEFLLCREGAKTEGGKLWTPVVAGGQMLLVVVGPTAQAVAWAAQLAAQPPGGI